MRILVLVGNVPATISMPGSPRLFSLCRCLSGAHNLILVTGSYSEERYRAFLDDPMNVGVFEKVIVLPGPGQSSWWSRQVHRLRQEVHFVTRYRNPEYHVALCNQVRALCYENNIDLVYADGLGVAQYVEDAQLDCPAAIDIHDCMSLLYSRMARAENRLLRKLALSVETWSVERCERSLSRTFGLIVTNSKVDETYFRGLNPAANTMTIGNGVDCDYFQPQADRQPDMRKLIFTGVMDYGPNVDATKYFCDAILPLIQEEFPDVEFWVVGKDPSDEVEALGGRKGVRVTGGVPDMRPYLEMCGVFVSPIRYGAGVKNKILAALAMESGVVASQTSIEGLNLSNDRHLLTADDPVDFAGKVLSLIRDPAKAKALGRCGRESVRSEYSWDASGRQLEDEFLALAARRD